MVVFAKQEHCDPDRFVLHPEPLNLNYDEFERLLFAASWHVCLAHKKREQFIAFLSETLGDVYRKAGVLV